MLLRSVYLPGDGVVLVKVHEIKQLIDRGVCAGNPCTLEGEQGGDVDQKRNEIASEMPKNIASDMLNIRICRNSLVAGPIGKPNPYTLLTPAYPASECATQCMILVVRDTLPFSWLPQRRT